MKDQDLKKWSCVQLKTFLRERGLKTSGKKADLVLRVLDANEDGVPTSVQSEKDTAERLAKNLTSDDGNILPDPKNTDNWVEGQFCVAKGDI